MLGLARLRRTPSACLCFWAYPSIGPGPDGLDPTRKKTSLMLSERRLGSSGNTRREFSSSEAIVSVVVILRQSDITSCYYSPIGMNGTRVWDRK
ncbi:hypothetical protein Tco_0317145 [Tanacetum coccineum]